MIVWNEKFTSFNIKRRQFHISFYIANNFLVIFTNFFIAGSASSWYKNKLLVAFKRCFVLQMKPKEFINEIVEWIVSNLVRLKHKIFYNYMWLFKFDISLIKHTYELNGFKLNFLKLNFQLIEYLVWKFFWLFLNYH